MRCVDIRDAEFEKRRMLEIVWTCGRGKMLSLIRGRTLGTVGSWKKRAAEYAGRRVI